MADIHHTRPSEGEGLRKAVLCDKLNNAKSDMLHERLPAHPLVQEDQDQVVLGLPVKA